MAATEQNQQLVTVGALLGIFLAGIDSTIVSTAMPTIVQQIHGLELYSWVFAAYMLFGTISMPIFGRLADMYSRKRLFLGGVGIFVLGSVLCGLAQSMEQLIGFRSVQGIGAGALYAIPYTILGVEYPPDQRGRAIGYGSAMWGLSSVFGPLLGYVIVSTLSWRWVFYLSVPIGIAAVTLITTSMDESTGNLGHHVDYAGGATLALSVGVALLGVELLESSPVLATGLVFVGLAGLVVFVRIETRAQVPIVPLELLENRVFVLTNAIGFLSSFVIFGALTYVPLYVQAIHGGPASAALAVFPLAIGWSGTSYLSGRGLSNVDERPLITAGTIVLVVSLGAGWFWSPQLSLAIVLANACCMGVGMGLVTPPLLTLIQNEFTIEQLGVATASQQFFRNLGGTIGVAVLGVVMSAVMNDRLQTVPGGGSLGALETRLLTSTTPPPGLAAVLTHGITRLLLVAAVVVSGAVVLARLLPRASGDDT